MYCFIVKNCPTCAKQKVQKTKFEKQIFEPGVQPMEFGFASILLVSFTPIPLQKETDTH